MEDFGDITLRLLYPPERISAEVRRLADAISADYAGGELLLVVVLKGAFIFAADLVRCITIPFQLDFVRLSSYSGANSTGEVRVFDDIRIPMTGKDVLIVEDILDTGLSLRFLVDKIMAKSPKSIKVCALIDKKGRRCTEAAADYVGITCSDGFLVGYGLDLNEGYRQLPAIYELGAPPFRGGRNDSTM